MKVVLYSIPGCTRCAMLRKKLNAKGIEFEDREDGDAIEAMGFTIAPILEVDGHIMELVDANEWVKGQ